MISEICAEEKCVGCGLCTSVCPKGAVSMKLKNGFYRPIISEACVDFKACINNCISSNWSGSGLNSTPDVAYAAWSRDDYIHYESSSGGLAYMIASDFIQNGGAVVGIWFNPGVQRVEHRLYETTAELKQMRGSRYVQSYKGKIYKTVGEKLKDKDVLFIGVPCEVYAMRRYVAEKDFQKRLYSIDILCHGGSSPQCLAEHIKTVSHGRRVCDISFRGGKYDCNFVVWGENGKKLFRLGQYLDPYFAMFMKRTIYQKQCYQCRFASSTRVGDITLGDFWGLDIEIEQQTSIRGINMVFINTVQGNELINKIEGYIVKVQRPIEEAIAGNDTLHVPTMKPTEYEALWNRINQEGFHKAIKEQYDVNLCYNIIKWRVLRIKSQGGAVLRRCGIRLHR